MLIGLCSYVNQIFFVVVVVKFTVVHFATLKLIIGSDVAHCHLFLYPTRICTLSDCIISRGVVLALYCFLVFMVIYYCLGKQ